MPGIKDIAKIAGVSPSTVSNALNGRANCSEATRNKILKICRELDYQPNEAAKALKNGTARTILFIFSDFDRKFYLEVIHGISDYVYSRGYDLIICSGKSAEKFMSGLYTCGAIVQDITCPDSLLIKKAENGFPLVLLDRVLGQRGIKSVVVGNYQAERELVSGLVDKGFRHFAFLGGPESDDTRQRFRGFRDVLREHDIVFKSEDHYTGDFRENSGRQAARLIMLSENMPQVLVCANDTMAIGAIGAFKENNIRVPEDIAVCGFDDREMSEVYGLTTVSIPYYEIGYLAAQDLIEMIDGGCNYDTFTVNARVQWRNSTQKAISGKNKRA